MPARAWSPLLVKVTARLTVSPGTRPVAATESRFAVEPTAPTSIFTVPDATAALAEVVEVNVPNVPRPATLAAAPRRTVEARTLPPVLVRAMRMTGSRRPVIGTGAVAPRTTTLEPRPQAGRRRMLKKRDHAPPNLKNGARSTGGPAYGACLPPYGACGLGLGRSAGLVADPVGQLGDLVVDRPALGHQLADLAVGVHDRGVVA